jgi:hypothetical protein
MIARPGSGGSVTELSVTGRYRGGPVMELHWSPRHPGAVQFCSFMKNSRNSPPLKSNPAIWRSERTGNPRSRTDQISTSERRRPQLMVQTERTHARYNCPTIVGSPEHAAHHAANQATGTAAATAVMASATPAATTGRVIGFVAARGSGLRRRGDLGQ